MAYALDTVGNVSYAQSRHGYWYENISGHLSDCSGYVCNIWRDRIPSIMTVGGLNGAFPTTQYMGPGTEGLLPGDIILVSPGGGDAEHALIYIGEFDTGILNSMSDSGSADDGRYTKTGTTQVYTVDLSSMVSSTEKLPQRNKPMESIFPSLLNWSHNNSLTTDNYKPQEDVPQVRSGNTRFAARSYLQSGGNFSNIRVLSIVKQPRVNNIVLNDDYTGQGIGSTGDNYWEDVASSADMIVRGEVDVYFDDQEYVALLKGMGTTETQLEPFHQDGLVPDIDYELLGDGTGADLVRFALQFVGGKYVWGGETLGVGVDCSGFTMQVYKNFGVTLPHYDESQRQYGRHVNSIAEARPGDLLFYGGHVAIYMGNDQMVHAANSRSYENGGGIRIQTVSTYYKQPIEIKRYLPEENTYSTPPDNAGTE